MWLLQLNKHYYLLWKDQKRMALKFLTINGMLKATIRKGGDDIKVKG